MNRSQSQFNLELPRGMKDFEETELAKIELIRQKFLETSKLFGFKFMDPSPIESKKLWKSNQDQLYEMRFIFSKTKQIEK